MNPAFRIIPGILAVFIVWSLVEHFGAGPESETPAGINTAGVLWMDGTGWVIAPTTHAWIKSPRLSPHKAKFWAVVTHCIHGATDRASE
jgi:hypothetical protein